jgi:hypothetical protein
MFVTWLLYSLPFILCITLRRPKYFSLYNADRQNDWWTINYRREKAQPQPHQGTIWEFGETEENRVNLQSGKRVPLPISKPSTSQIQVYNVTALWPTWKVTIHLSASDSNWDEVGPNGLSPRKCRCLEYCSVLSPLWGGNEIMQLILGIVLHYLHLHRSTLLASAIFQTAFFVKSYLNCNKG